MEIQMRDGVAVIRGGEVALSDGRGALDLIAEAHYAHGADGIALDKRLVAEDFFRLSTGVAGEILQKFINYHMRLAVYGDFSGYASKPLRDFMYESNNGRDVFFTATEDEAIARLTGARDGA